MADLDLPAFSLNEDTRWPGLQHAERWEKQAADTATGVSPWDDSPTRDAEAHAAFAEAHAAAETATGTFPASRAPGTPESHQGKLAAAVQRATRNKHA